MKHIIFAGSMILILASCSHKDHQKTEDSPAEAAATAVSPTKAQAVFTAAKGQKIKGIVHFTEVDGTMKIETRIDGVKPGPHGFHIHETGDCSAADFSTAGGHFNPGNVNHGAMDSSSRHTGDLGNLIADKNGKAYTTLTIKDMTMKSGANSVIGKSIVIHNDKDDLNSQPSGNSGARIGCGVIQAL